MDWIIGIGIAAAFALVIIVLKRMCKRYLKKVENEKRDNNEK